MDDEIRERILHLYSVEKLSIRQIAEQLHISRRTAADIINSSNCEKVVSTKVSNLDQYKSLIGQWYKDILIRQDI